MSINTLHKGDDDDINNNNNSNNNDNMVIMHTFRLSANLLSGDNEVNLDQIGINMILYSQ